MLYVFAGGVLSGSLALATDASHLACDLAGFLVSLAAIWLARKRATSRMSFGFYRVGETNQISYISQSLQPSTPIPSQPMVASLRYQAHTKSYCGVRLGICCKDSI